MIALQLEECTAPIGSNNSPAELHTAIRIALAYDSTTTPLRTRVSHVRVRVRDDSRRNPTLHSGSKIIKRRWRWRLHRRTQLIAREKRAAPGARTRGLHRPAKKGKKGKEKKRDRR
jgi:hypothetical protein